MVVMILFALNFYEPSTMAPMFYAGMFAKMPWGLGFNPHIYPVPTGKHVEIPRVSPYSQNRRTLYFHLMPIFLFFIVYCVMYENV